MKKIMFNDKYGLTKAVLEGRKTQTRRIIKMPYYDEEYLDTAFDWDFRESVIVDRYAKYKVGEVVAVAQDYKTIDDFYKAAFSYNHSVHGMTICEFDGVSDKDIKKWNMIAINYRGKKSWTNKLFVKPELMIHFIRITNVRIQRLQDISDDDCLAEGILKEKTVYREDSYNIKVKDKAWYYGFDTPREAYAALIDKVGKKGDWESNPYVFVYEFELIK